MQGCSMSGFMLIALAGQDAIAKEPELCRWRDAAVENERGSTVRA